MIPDDGESPFVRAGASGGFVTGVPGRGGRLPSHDPRPVNDANIRPLGAQGPARVDSNDARAATHGQADEPSTGKSFHVTSPSGSIHAGCI